MNASTDIDRADPLPLWAQLLAILRRRIARGEYGASFPTDAQLADEFDLSRHTVREAVRRLQDEGVVNRRRGVGSVVATPVFEQSTGAMYSLFRSIESQGREQRSDLIDLSTTTDAGIATRLDLPDAAPLVRAERLRRVDGEPLAHDTSWLPLHLAQPLLDVDFGRTGLYDELARTCGIEVDAGTEWIHPMFPSPAERARLELGRREAAFLIERLVRAGGRAVEWRESVVRGDRYTFVANWSPTARYRSVLAPAESAP
ncbi:MAG: GntR family transcriptional regulator [Ilumatobacteraceae bacterium]